MYIISKTKDYYDGVVGTMGIDKSLVYERNTVINEDYNRFPEPFKPGKVLFGHVYRDGNPFRDIMYSYSVKKQSMYEAKSLFIVGFCGKLYVGWKFYYESKGPSKFSYPKLVTSISYNLDFVKNHVEFQSWRANLQDDLDYINNYRSMDLFRKLNTPVFLYDSSYGRMSIGGQRSKEVFIVNPILKDYEFYKVIDSFTAFQEIQMFLGGVLGVGEKEIIEVEDKYKISQHGFDKHSFRRSKAEGKKRPNSKR